MSFCKSNVVFPRGGIMGSARWVSSLWLIFFEGRAKKIKVQIEPRPIGPAQIGSRAITAWVGLAHLAHFLF